MSIPFDELIEEELKATRLAEDARTKAEQTLSEARKRAQRLIDQATKAESIQAIMKAEEEKAEKEAEAILESYRRRAQELGRVSKESFDKAVELAVAEVLKLE